eukprot:GFKZ01000139.1.p3 GENE.GFKZ01000139.1~~GFKZ01000139.1.p3  ORF type:complete len:128 (-),score=9.29 GFKZ01000139.1:312-695(-)
MSIQTQGVKFRLDSVTKAGTSTGLESLDTSCGPSWMLCGGGEGAGHVGADNKDVDCLWPWREGEVIYEDVHAESLVGREVVLAGERIFLLRTEAGGGVTKDRNKLVADVIVSANIPFERGATGSMHT